jgi:hypothetical protein
VARRTVKRVRERVAIAEVDLCKINTARLRTLTAGQLQKAIKKIGHSFEFPRRLAKNDPRRVNEALARFAYALQNAKGLPFGTGEERAKWRAGYAKDAEHYERKIWDMQAKAGCKIPGEELVARDAEREGRKEDAAQARAQRRRPPTPYKGRKPRIR